MDVKVFFDKNRKLQTTVYEKPTKKNTYLHRKSFHPTHIFNNIIFNQIIRFNGINSNKHLFRNQIKLLINRFQKRGYTSTLIKRQIKKAIRRSLQPIKPKKSRFQNTSCKLAHNIHIKYQQQTISKIWKRNISKDLKKTWPNPLQFITTNQPNLKKLLIRAKTST